MEKYGNINPEAMSMLEILRKQKAVELIPVDAVLQNRFQPRSFFDEEELCSLGESIRENGLIQPISVRKIKGGFELIAGERRLRACKLIGKDKIEAIVYDISDEECAVWALIENLQREGLSPFDEAEAMAKLISAWDISREEAAKRLGLAPSSLSNKLRLLKLPEEVKKIITENNLTERHARELLRLEKDYERENAARQIAAKGMNVPQAEKYISSLLEEKKPKRKMPKYLIKDMRIFINTFEHAVKVMDSAGLSPVSSVTESEDSITYSVSVLKAKAFRSAGDTADKSAAPVHSACVPTVI